MTEPFVHGSISIVVEMHTIKLKIGSYMSLNRIFWWQATSRSGMQARAKRHNDPGAD